MNKDKFTNVNFNYSFAPPHRICISLPEASKKCLVDCYRDCVSISWSDDDLTKIPVGAFYGPQLKWFFNITAEIDGKKLNGYSWRRVENRLPAIEYIWLDDSVSIKMIGASASDWDIFKFEVKNLNNKKVDVNIFGKMKDLAFNTMWIDPNSKFNASLAHYGDRSDRILFFSTYKPKKLRTPSSLDVSLELSGYEEKNFFFIRPHNKKIDDLEYLISKDWDTELNFALNIWREIINKSQKLIIPDKLVEDAYYSCFFDIFVAREKNADGLLAGLAGTDLYRCMNTCEPVIGAIVLDHSGLYKESESVMEGIFALQDEKTGRWDDYRAWGHDIGWIPGPRCWWIKEHYLFTRDKNFLLKGFEKIYKHVKWAHNERQKTKVLNEDGSKPLTFGLLPRGMGDGGLMDDDDYYGHYIPSNVWYCFIIKIALWAAQELNLDEKRKELQYYLEDALQCTLSSMREGAILETNGIKWIPGVPGKTSGSRFAATSSIYPCELIDPFDELADGTLKKLELNLSEGGLPKDLGWLKGGLWVAIALDNLAYAHIAREEYDEAANYIYPVINHGSPLFTWCEERMPEPNSSTITGDLQHTWTPHILNKFIRDSLIIEWKDILMLACATPREWLNEKMQFGVKGANTHFGYVNYIVNRIENDIIKFSFSIEKRYTPSKVKLFLRIPEKHKTIEVISISLTEGFSLRNNVFEFDGNINEIVVDFKIF